MVVGGLDLAAYEHRCSGFAVIDETDMVLKKLDCLYGDIEIIENAKLFSVDVLAIDAPVAESPRFREVDREAIRRGFRVMPPTFKHMKELTLRAWRLSRELSSLGIIVIETHPRSALVNSGAHDVNELLDLLGISVNMYQDKLKKKDLKDALIAALVALCYKRKYCLGTLKATDGTIHILAPLKR